MSSTAEHDQCLTFGQCLANPQYAGFQRCVIAIVRTVASHEILDQAGEGVDFKLVVGNQHRHLGENNVGMLRRMVGGG